MKYFFAIIIAGFFSVSYLQKPTGIDLLKKMHEKYAGKWYKNFSFNQTTEIYRNDSLMRTQTWYENIQFPKNFRIDFGNLDSGNAIVFSHDSSYLFRNAKLIKAKEDDNDLLFILGGMYFYSTDSVMQKMKLYGYDVNKLGEGIWKGEPVYILGADNDKDSANQLWIEKTHYSPVRIITYKNNIKEEAVLDVHKPLAGGFTETLVHFYINNKLVQVEKYHDLKGNTTMDPAIFDPEKFVKLKL